MRETSEESAIDCLLDHLPPQDAALLEKRATSDQALSKFILEMRETQALAIVAEACALLRSPRLELRSRIFQRIANVPQQRFPDAVAMALKEAGFAALELGNAEAVVYAGQEGMLRWANPAFTQLCGYSLEELSGRKPGAVLQGAKSDPVAVQALRIAVQKRIAVKRKLVNYHKNGSDYQVEIDLRPVTDGFIAVERRLENLELAVS